MNATGGADEVMEGRLSSCDRGCRGTSERGWEPPRDVDSLTLHHGSLLSRGLPGSADFPRPKSAYKLPDRNFKRHDQFSCLFGERRRSRLTFQKKYSTLL